MFDYTKAALTKIGNDIKKVSLLFNISTQLLSIVYLVYVLCARSGFFFVNLLLLVLSCGYFGFFLHVTFHGGKKALKKIVARCFSWCKRLIKLFNLGVMLYGLSFTATNISPLSLIIAVFMIISWVLDFLFEILSLVYNAWKNLVVEGLKADYENAPKPLKYLIGKTTGLEVEENKEPTKRRSFLDQKVAEARAKKEEKRSQAKLAARERKKAEKLAKKARKRVPSEEEIAVTEDK